MKIISSIVSVVFAVALVMMVAVPVIGDSINNDDIYHNDGAQRYTFYAGDSIPDRHFTYDGTDFKIDGVNYELKRLTPAAFTSKVAISSISGVSVTHGNLLTTTGTAYKSQIVGLASLDITVSGGKISGTLVKGETTYTLPETAIDWAFFPAKNGAYTAVSIDAGSSIYTDSLNSLAYVSAPGNAFVELYNGTATSQASGNPTTTAAELFTDVDTLHDGEGGTVLKVNMPPGNTSFFKADSTFWIMAPATVVHHDLEVSTEDQLISFIPLLLILGIIIGVIGLIVRRA